MPGREVLTRCCADVCCVQELGSQTCCLSSWGMSCGDVLCCAVLCDIDLPVFRSLLCAGAGKPKLSGAEAQPHGTGRGQQQRRWEDFLTGFFAVECA